MGRSEIGEGVGGGEIKKIGKGENHTSEESKTSEDYKTANKIIRLRNLGPANYYK